MTLACTLIAAGRAGERLPMARLCTELKISEEELREDIDVLNVVNFGGGSYVLYAEVDDASSEVEVDPEPYSDNFDRPARLLPVEAKALIAAIDLIGEHIPEGSLATARRKIVEALGSDPMEQGLQVVQALADDKDCTHRLQGDHRTQAARARVLQGQRGRADEPAGRAVRAGQRSRGWYVAAYDPDREDVRHFRLDRIEDRDRHEREVQAARGCRPGRRSRRLAAHRRGRGGAHGTGLDLAGARALGARVAARRGGVE